MDNVKDFELFLVDPNKALCAGWEEKFRGHHRVNIFNDYFERIASYDCMVSAANSFGVMDGGVDLAIRRYFGRELQERVQERIKEEYFGEQPVGTSMIVETGNGTHPFLAHTPTMRVPYKVTRTDNVYVAMFAMLRAVANHNKSNDKKIKKVVCSGLGTSAGGVPPKEAARQMELAYRNFYNPPKFYTWSELFERQKEIGFGGDVWGKYIGF